MILSTYNLKPEDLGKLPQRIYSELLFQVPAVVAYKESGKIIDKEGELLTARENIKWLKEQGLLKPKKVNDGRTVSETNS